MAAIATMRSYVTKMLTEVSGMKALLMDEDTVRLVVGSPPAAEKLTATQTPSSPSAGQIHFHGVQPDRVQQQRSIFILQPSSSAQR